MRAILLSAGLGTRLRPITNRLPKCLVPINGRPLIDYWLELLFCQGIEKILINTHHHAEKIYEHVAQSKWHDRITLVREAELLGTGGSVLKNRHFFNNNSFLVAHSDNLTRFNLQDFQKVHSRRADHVKITMMTFKTNSPRECGIVRLDKNGVVQEIHEKVNYDVGRLANGAIYIFDQSVILKMESLKAKQLDISTQVLPLFLGGINTFFNDDYLRDIGSLASLEQAHLDARKRLI